MRASIPPELFDPKVLVLVGALESGPHLQAVVARTRDTRTDRARPVQSRDRHSALVVEESTIRTHAKRILMKLGLRDRIQIVIFAYENGITDACAHNAADSV